MKEEKPTIEGIGVDILCFAIWGIFFEKIEGNPLYKVRIINKVVSYL